MPFLTFPLSSGKHHDKVDVVAILNGFNEFIGVGRGIIDKNLNIVLQFVFSDKQRFLHSGKLPDELVQTFAHCSPLHRYHLQAVGILTMSGMNMDINRHIYLIPANSNAPLVTPLFRF